MTIGPINQLFSRALDGLAVAQKGMSVASNNIANVNTEGYARQVFSQGSRSVFGDGTLGGGVAGLAVRSIVDPFVERQLVNESSDFGTYDGRRLTLQSLENIVSDLDGTGIGSAMSSFFNAWSDLSQNPANGALRQTVRERGRLLTERFTSASSQINQLRSNLSSTIESRVSQINTMTTQIAEYNRAIVNASDPSAKEELKSARQLIVRKLSEEIGINYFETQDESLTVQVEGSGFSLVSRFQAANLTVADDPTIGGTMTINAAFPGVAGSGVDITNSITSGRLGGNLIDRNTTLNDRIADLDELAYTFINQINTAHQSGYGLDGNTGRNFFSPPGAQAGAASNFRLDNTVIASLDAIAAAGQDPAVSGVGDSANAANIVNLRNAMTMSSGSQTFNQFFSSMQAEVGIVTGQINQTAIAKTNLVKRLEMQRENISGVNIDEEAADLIRYQKAFEASARVLSAANDMIDTLIRI